MVKGFDCCSPGDHKISYTVICKNHCVCLQLLCLALGYMVESSTKASCRFFGGFGGWSVWRGHLLSLGPFQSSVIQSSKWKENCHGESAWKQWLSSMKHTNTHTQNSCRYQSMRSSHPNSMTSVIGICRGYVQISKKEIKHLIFVIQV